MTPQNGQTHSNNSSATADKLFKCTLLFCGVCAKRVKDEERLNTFEINTSRLNPGSGGRQHMHNCKNMRKKISIYATRWL